MQKIFTEKYNVVKLKQASAFFFKFHPEKQQTGAVRYPCNLNEEIGKWSSTWWRNHKSQYITSPGPSTSMPLHPPKLYQFQPTKSWTATKNSLRKWKKLKKFYLISKYSSKNAQPMYYDLRFLHHVLPHLPISSLTLQGVSNYYGTKCFGMIPLVVSIDLFPTFFMPF